MPEKTAEVPQHFFDKALADIVARDRNLIMLIPGVYDVLAEAYESEIRGMWESDEEYVDPDKQRNVAIQTIESLFPPDGHEDGPELLLRAIAQAWRDLPWPFLEKLLAINVTENSLRERS